MKYLCKLLLWSFLGTTVKWVCAQNAERFVNEILREYRTVDQAGRADTSRDGVITAKEFARSLYQNADFEGNNDNGVTMNEFVDHYVTHYNISSELAIFMFDLLNDPGHSDNIISSKDITLRSFLGQDYASPNEYRDALQKWVTQAARSLYNVLISPHIMDQSHDLSPRYDILSNVDTNSDGFVSFQELKEEFQKLSPNQGDVHVKRNAWIESNVHKYGADPVTSILTFDYWDRDGDLVITTRDLEVATLDLDRNGDGRISQGEYLQYFERGYKLSRRISGKSIKLPKRACSGPWWSKLRSTPSIDAMRAVMDFDDDFDGWVSLDNVKRWMMLFDTNGDGSLNRNEYLDQQSTRYGVNSTIASTMFDLVDVNGDDRVGDEDWMNQFKGGIEISFCDAWRSVLDLARMAEKFHRIPQASVKRASMKDRLKEEWDYFLQNEQASGWMALDPYSYPQNGLCQGQVACYEGEQTKAWGLRGASLWWVQDVLSGWSPDNMDSMVPMTGGPMLSGVLPGVLMGGPLAFKRATDSPSSQNKSPEQSPRQVSGLGISSSSQPNSNNFQFGGSGFPRQYPSMNNNKGQLSNPLMKQYQRLFNQQSSFGPQSNLGVTNPMANFNTNERNDARANFPFRSQFMNEKQNQNFGPIQKEQSDFRTGSQGMNMKPTAQSWSPSNTINADATPRPLTNFPMQNQMSQNPQLPFIGLSAYPLVLNLDPSASLLWRTMTRMRKALSRNAESSDNGISKTYEETQAPNLREKRDENAAKEKENQNTEINETDLYENSIQWNPIMADFRPSPFDIWMSWALEKFMWENEHIGPNKTDGENGTIEGFEDLEKIWDEIGTEKEEKVLNGEGILTSETDTQENPSDSREKRNADRNEFKQDNRHKRWILYVQRLRRNPYLSAMRNLWPRYYCFPPFDYFSWRSRVRFPLFWYPCYMYNHNMLPWWRGTVYPYQNHMWRRYKLAKRSRRETTEPEADDRDLNLKRAFSFDNWFKNKQGKPKQFKQNDNRFMSQSPSSTNTWKTVESSKYGMKDNWGQRLEEESSQWGASTKETYDYNSNGKWKDNQRPNNRYQNGYNNPATFSSMGGSIPSFSGPGNERQWGTGRHPSLQNDMQWMDPYYEVPSNFAAFLMPSLVGMTWNKRKINNGPQQGFHERMSGKFKLPNNAHNMPNQFQQANWKQQEFSPNRVQWSNSMRGEPWVNGNDPSSLFAMINQGPFMWTRRFVRKSSDELNSLKKSESDTQNKRQTRSVNDVEKYKLSHMKKFFKKIKNKNKSSMRVASWMPWESWKILRYKKLDKTLSTNRVLTKSKMILERKERDVSDSNEIQKRHGMWNMMYPWNGNWNGMWNSWRPWYNWYRWNYMRYTRNSDAESDIGTRDKRDTKETDRAKRWGYNNPMSYWNGWNWNQWMNYQWNPWYNNMRFNRESGTIDDPTLIQRYKRDAEEKDLRSKRFGMWNMMYPWYGKGNRNGMWNRWYPWYNWNWRNYMRYPRYSKLDNEDDALQIKNKRDSENTERLKRWGYNNPMWYGNGWNNWMNYQWNPWYNNYMRFARDSEDTINKSDDTGREKRDTEDNNARQKRFGMWNMMSPWYGQGNWNGMWNRWYPWHNWYSWNYMRFPRNSKLLDASKIRDKREVEEIERSKRWGFNNPMWYGNGWNNWMNYQWNPWYNYMRFTRESDDDANYNVDHLDREKRSMEDNDERQKRFGMWNMMYPWYGQGNWNGMWNRWNPWHNWSKWNYMRYPRNVSPKEEDSTSQGERNKRDTKDTDRTKRWGYNNLMWYGNGWNQWMNYQWNPWYNNYMRYARESEDSAENSNDLGREKREADDENLRQKRYGMWNMMYPWNGQGNWNGMWNRWYPWNRWNFMRYPRQSESHDASETRDKRDAEETERSKRWGYNNPIWYENGWDWNQWMNYQWYPWNNNYMRVVRKSDDVINHNIRHLGREKRGVEDNRERQKRFGMWNMMYPWYGQGNWNGMWNRWNPWYNWSKWNYMRYPRNVSPKEEESISQGERNKRDTKDTDRTKRWGFNNPMWYGNGWNQWMNYQWNPWYNNYMRFPRRSEDTNDNLSDVEREKRDVEDKNQREKRFGMWNTMYPWYGQGNWNGMWNRWFPGYNWYRWNHMRYPRNLKSKITKDSRDKRNGEDNERSKRWGYNNPMWYGNGWNYWMNYQWNPWHNYMRLARESEDDSNHNIEQLDRKKRDLKESNERQKRFGMWNMMHPWYGQGNWNGMWNRWYPWYNSYRWNYMRYPRNSVQKEENSIGQEQRNKRDTKDTDRTKRWGYNNPMWYGNGWNYWMNYQWNPWYNNYMRFPRESEDSVDNSNDMEREKRDVEDESLRQKRYGMWNMMYPWYGQGNWNGMWNRWYPWYNSYRGNYMRYPRNSVQKEENSIGQEERNKRDTKDIDRTKRWGYNNPMWYGNGWNYWMNYQWNPWYNNYMRFPRESEDSVENSNNIEREKRDVEDENLRQKRYGMWNMMYPWYGQGNWNGMWNLWYPGYNWNRWNYMRYPRNFKSKTAKGSREKRDAEDNERLKRWDYNNPMWYGNRWNHWMNYQWNPWYNYMRFSRESEDDTNHNVEHLEKRDVEESNERQKRFGMWNMMNPWYGQGNWNGMWNRWYPWYNWYKWNYMRYPRNSVQKEEDIISQGERNKRDTKDTDRTKRWGYNNPMWYGNGWNQWMNYQWNPWYNNYMRYPRESEDSVDNTNDMEREKRDVQDESLRQKRYGMWNMMYPWYGQGNWNGMWNRWYPGYNWNRWNYMRYPRNFNSETAKESRDKRDAEDNERPKRWDYNNPMWYGNRWNYWMNYQWNPWYNYMRFSRESEDDTNHNVEHLEKRDVEESNERQKRFGMWNMMSPWYGQGNWNGVWNRWYPWYNWNRWNYMRYPRNPVQKEEDTLSQGERNKRDTNDTDRTKRWGFNNPMWYGNGWNQWMNYQWNPWYNNYMRFSRESEDDSNHNVEHLDREKRDLGEGIERQKRFGMWNMMYPWYGQGNWNGMRNRWYPWYNWNRWNYMRYPRNSNFQDVKDTQEIRNKRDTKDTERFKRWGYNNPMWQGTGWNYWMNYQWNQWYNNYMRFARETEDTVNTSNNIGTVKRDAEGKIQRQKRYGMWNMMYPWYGQGNWNGMWDRWNPWYNSYRGNYMRYPRHSNLEGTPEIRDKRDAAESVRSKRWGHNNPMWYRNGWNWNQWMNYQSYPWYNNYMRFARESEDLTDDVSVNEDLDRVKRDTKEDISRQKRFGVWNMMYPWYGQGNWNRMWNRWYPWYRWNFMRFPRDIESHDALQSRDKRDAEETERPKRWGYNNPMWYGNGWNWNQWMNYQWYPWNNNYMRFSRETEIMTDGTTEHLSREKRQTEENSPRQKRFGMWSMMYPWYGQGNWNGMGNRWYPFYNWQRWNYMRYPRNSDSNISQEIRDKRDTEDTGRTKRWGYDSPMWYGNGRNHWMNYQWYPWYNNMRFVRESANTDSRTGRNKRQTSQHENKENFNFQKQPANWKTKSFATSDSKGNNLRSHNENIMKQLLEHRQRVQNDQRIDWLNESKINNDGVDGWTSKWRRWMGKRWMNNSGRGNNYNWFWPRFPWMWQGQQWGDPMMFYNNPWFHHGGW